METKQVRVLEKAPAYRWVIWVVMMFNYIVCYTSNQAVATFAVEMMEWMHIGPAALSTLSNGGTIGLMIANIIGGALLVKTIGGKNTFTLGALIETLCGIVWMTAPTNYALVLVVRVLQGFGGGCISTCALSLLGCWFPRTQRASAEGVLTGIYGFGIAAFSAVAGILSSMNWTWYEITGRWMLIVGGVSLLLDIFVLKDLYRTYGVHLIDDAIIGVGEGGNAATALDPLTAEKRRGLHKLSAVKEMLRSGAFWHFLIITFVLTYFIFGLAYVLPLLFVTDLGMTAAESTAAQTWSFLGSGIGCVAGGLICDRLAKSRRMPAIAFAFLWATVFCVLIIPAAGMTVGVLSAIAFLAMSGAPMATACTWTTPTELFTPVMVTAGTGIGLFFSNLGGTVCTAVTGFLAESTGSYFPGLYVMIAFGVVGIISAQYLSRKYRL